MSGRGQSNGKNKSWFKQILMELQNNIFKKENIGRILV